MSHDGKAGKRKITQSKTPKSSSKTPSPSDQLQPDQPAAPGTEGPAGTMAGQNVHLEAYVWQENVDAGLVVMNVKWRGKTYCGAFIDIEKHNWQPPRLGEAAPEEADHFTRGRNKRSLNSESERGDDDTPTKRGRNKGKKKRGAPSNISKKIKKAGNEAAAVAGGGGGEAGPSPVPSPSSVEGKAGGAVENPPSPAKQDDTKEKVDVKTEEVVQELEPTETPKSSNTSSTSATPTPPAAVTPVMPSGEGEKKEGEGTPHSVINSYSPHSKKVKNATKLTPIPQEMYGSESVIRTFNSPLNMPPMKSFINASPRNMGYVVPHQEMLGAAAVDINASKPQVIVKPERRDIQWNKHTNLPVLKPQPHFTAAVESSQAQGGVLPMHALASINQQFMKEQAQQHHLHQQQQQQMKKNEQFGMSFKPGDQLGHAFRNASSMFAKNSNITNTSEYNALSQLQRHFYHQAAAAAGEKPEQLLAAAEHRPNQEAAHSLLQLARPFTSKVGNPAASALDQLQYFSRMNNVAPISSTGGPHGAGQPQQFPPPRFSAENKEELAKLMAFPNVPPKFPIPQVGKFR